MEVLTDDVIAQRLAALEAGGEAGASPAPRRFVKPLLAAADSLIEALRIEDGIGLGLADIDVLTRGFRPTDFVIVTGFAHSGKTQLINTMVLNNPDKRVLFFSLDDPAEMILAKLVAMHSGVPSEDIERAIRKGDAKMTALIRTIAQEHLSNLLVVDDVIGINAMQEAVRESAEVWGAGPDAVVVDYIEMMPGGAVSDDELNTIKAKATDIKKWARQAPYPVIALHQGTRSNSKPGDPISILSMNSSGEQQATIVVGCRRKRERADLEAWERTHHEKTITVHVVKNKRPGGRLTHYDGIDFHIEPATGLIRPMEATERRELFPNSAASRVSDSEQAVLEGLGVQR